ncbi:alpha/beta-hydrolase [Auriscalpium vulgare]|uniref:Alpha/beta-hydrolase n=1 Tax=Auriscalpium vulgare TaxID=40419 RepID=A0ACB8RZ60_9AGAM|nr:alpha/beta-hydrolase [Auriscalpium vulgare]
MTTGVEQPFKVSVSDDAIALLRRKLSDARFPDELDEAGWAYGAPLADVKRLAARWQDGYNWREHEAKLNELPMFTRDIEVDGFGVLNVHYVHQKSEVDGAIPLLFVHGWPGSFLEVRKILPLLIASSADHPSFHVVAPSLPNFGFSDGPKKKGFQGKHYAEVFNKLMLSLGYTEYVTQGGDWGHILTRITAAEYGPKHVKASHTNFPREDSPPALLTSPTQYLKHLVTPYTALEKAGLARMQWFMAEGRGYSLEQSTTPQTLGYALADSPVGLLAWIYEKLVTWTDGYAWDDDEVLTWISVYWFSRAGPAASVRIYYEFTHAVSRPDSPVPVGVSFFPKELIRPPVSWVKAWKNVVYTSQHEHGGHFAAHEQPEALVEDLRAMFGKGGPAANVVPGKSGYASV